MYLDGLTPDEMSAVLGITGNAISVRINRLKQKFTDAYVDCARGGPMNLGDMRAAWSSEMQSSGRAVRLRDLWMILALLLGSAIAAFAQWLTGDDVGWLSQRSVLVLIIVTATVAFALLRARRVTQSDDWTLRSRL